MCRGQFDTLDADKGGTLDVPEMREALRKLKQAAAKDVAATAAMQAKIAHLQQRADASKAALDATRDLERTKRDLERVKRGEIPLRDRLGAQLADKTKNANVGEIVQQWGAGGDGEISVVEFRGNISRMMKLEGKPESQAGGEIDDLFDELDKASISSCACASSCASCSPHYPPTRIAHSSRELQSSSRELLLTGTQTHLPSHNFPHTPSLTHLPLPPRSPLSTYPRRAQDGGGSMDLKELKSALKTLQELGRQVGNLGKKLERKLKENGATAREMQDELRRLLAEDEAAGAEAKARKEKEKTDKAAKLEEAKAAKAAKEAAKVAEAAAKKAEFEARVAAKR